MKMFEKKIELIIPVEVYAGKKKTTIYVIEVIKKPTDIVIKALHMLGVETYEEYFGVF